MMRAAADLGNRCAAARLPANCSVSRLALFVGGWVGGSACCTGVTMRACCCRCCSSS